MSSFILSSSSSSSTGPLVVKDSSVESGHIAAIIVCLIIGLTVLCYAFYRLAKIYCPNLLLAITPQDAFERHSTSPRNADKTLNEYEQQAAEMAAHMAAAPATTQGDKSAHDKKGDSYAVDIDSPSPLSVNEQWTVRDAPAEDEDN